MVASDAAALFRIRLFHTLAWAVFAGAIFAIPVVLAMGNLRFAIWLSALVWVEVAILAVNGMRCPLTAVAARHTDDRRDNFDIFLPEWLARENKRIFGTLFAAGQVWLAWSL
jgi:hypothetical protein